ncbi:N-acetylmuramoyl-L-alanine amidase [Neisseria sp. Ec49-e6-T10]|uniref:N-acetylmuramoyl-L-alanine amidase n=1 Tax=Neisseria sp. Ec49-e6-T10 TaxID=3140744 RepID=UPI003EBFF4E6
MFYFKKIFSIVGCLSLLMGCVSHLSDRQNYLIDLSHQSQNTGRRIQFIVLHYSAEDLPTSLKLLTKGNVSAHYVIPKMVNKKSNKPIVYQLVPESLSAWHAGNSYWRGRTHLNNVSIGIEIVNQGNAIDDQEVGWEPYTDEQIEVLIVLLKDIAHRYNIEPNNIIGHSDIAPTRKNDPGPAFNWRRLAKAGVGAWPDEELVTKNIKKYQHKNVDIVLLQQKLKKYGYRVPLTGILDQETQKVISAFQMHFRADNYSGYPDAETLAILDALLDKYHHDI